MRQGQFNNVSVAVCVFFIIYNRLMATNSKKILRIALDTMGGDFAPRNEVLGAFEVFGKGSKVADYVKIILVGDEKKIRETMKECPNIGNANYSIVHTDEYITMNDDPVDVIKTKKNSSLYKAIELHAKGEADAVVSAANTGAVLSISTILLGRLKGVSRPTIGTFLPGMNNTPVLVLDAGANVSCKPRFLYEFGIMGSIYTSEMLGISKPKIGLLSVGEEEHKGNDTVRMAHEMLSENKDINFIGNIEGDDIMTGKCDVVVCDGFIGNVVLKFAESITRIIKVKFKDFAAHNLYGKALAALALPALKGIFSQFNYEIYGGVPLIGISGVSIIGHGRSTPLAVKNMILKAIDAVEKNVNVRIAEALATPEK